MEFLRIGQLVNTHGVRGEVKIVPNTDYPEQRFAKGKQVFLKHASFSKHLPLTITQVRPHKTALLVRFDEWDNINQAEAWKGATVLVSQADTVEDGEDGYYFHQIIGCQVVTTDGQIVGRVKEILTLPANDVWVVARASKPDLLIPYIEAVVKKVDIDGRVITMEWMEGLE
jgi:16S rRNA processing protein RimM